MLLKKEEAKKTMNLVVGGGGNGLTLGYKSTYLEEVLEKVREGAWKGGTDHDSAKKDIYQ